MAKFCDLSAWSIIALLERALHLGPTTAELGLSMQATLTFGSTTRMEVTIHWLEVFCKVNPRYSGVRYDSRTNLASSIKKFHHYGRVYSPVLDLQAQLDSAPDEPSLHVWNESGIVEEIVGELCLQIPPEVPNVN